VCVCVHAPLALAFTAQQLLITALPAHLPSIACRFVQVGKNYAAHVAELRSILSAVDMGEQKVCGSPSPGHHHQEGLWVTITTSRFVGHHHQVHTCVRVCPTSDQQARNTVLRRADPPLGSPPVVALTCRSP